MQPWSHWGGVRVAAEDAAADTGRQRSTPTGLLRCEIEHGSSARRFAQQGATVFDRILLGCSGEFVDEALDHEDVVGGTDTAPPPRENPRRLLANVVDQDVGDRLLPLCR